GLAVYLEWLRRPVVPETVAADLGQHLMRFSLMEKYLERAEVIAFLADLRDALDGFVTGMEQFAAARHGTLGQHALLALEHGIATHRASLEWVRSAIGRLDDRPAALSSGGPGDAKGAAMTRPGTDSPQWVVVDEGWGRKAADFATLSEPGNCREYVAVHHRLGVDAGDRLLDVACGSGLAIELARLRGASCSGIDASPRLVAVARDRNPDCDIRTGDMRALPWDPASFDIVTSFRGIWGTTPEVVAEIYRVLRPGGRAGITVWGHLKASAGAWALVPFRLAAAEKVGNQAVMVSLGRPGAGEQLLQSYGFADVERLDVPFAWEFADPELYARALAATGPAYEAIQNVGEAEFHRVAVEQAREQLRDGLPLRADLKVVGYLARKPEGAEQA
ncbi:MAG TPA: class I SAM-dependent methyltransferase, partial [Streptosporangiaceae bacterium]|nr:class I SAM-dependent methyltransferase [Streptosporangiaceae bacterium]